MSFFNFRLTMGGIIITVLAAVLGVAINVVYILLAPANIAGDSNVGILMSVYGLSFMLVNRLYTVWKQGRPFVVLPTWMFGPALLVLGFVKWVEVYETTNLALFYIHWTIVIAILVFVFWKFQPKPEVPPLAVSQAGYPAPTDSQNPPTPPQ